MDCEIHKLLFTWGWFREIEEDGEWVRFWNMRGSLGLIAYMIRDFKKYKKMNSLLF